MVLVMPLFFCAPPTFVHSGPCLLLGWREYTSCFFPSCWGASACPSTVEDYLNVASTLSQSDMMIGAFNAWPTRLCLDSVFPLLKHVILPFILYSAALIGYVLTFHVAKAPSLHPRSRLIHHGLILFQGSSSCMWLHPRYGS